MKISAYLCSVRGTPWRTTLNCRSRGEAKSTYWRQVTDAWPDIPFTMIQVQCLGAPLTSDRFLHNARYRGVPHLRCGMEVLACGRRGVVVGHNESANFRVAFEDGRTGVVHPSELEVV